MQIIIYLLVIISMVCVAHALYIWRKYEDYPMPKVPYARLKFLLIGFLAFVSDTIGIGSFAPQVAVYRGLKLVPDELLPGALNMAQIVPGLIEALIFIKIVPVDLRTMVYLVIATCLGGITGGLIVTKIRPLQIKLGMSIAFVLFAIIVLIDQLNLIHIAGHSMALHGNKLIIGCIGLFLCGILPAFGVGYYAIVGVFFFLLGLSPLAAFPIMMVACALQEPFTTIMLLHARKVPLKAVFYVSLTGCLGVAVAAPIVTHLNLTALRWLLFIVVSYNAYNMILAYKKGKREENA